MDNKEYLSEKYKIDELAEEAGGYFAIPSEESLEYTNLLFSICDKYGISYYKATPKEKYFVEEFQYCPFDLCQITIVALLSFFRNVNG